VKQILLRKVPDDLHREVKTASAAAGKSMQDFIIALLRAAVKVKPIKRRTTEK